MKSVKVTEKTKSAAINIRRIQRRLLMNEATTQTIALLALLLKGVMERINPHLWG